MKKFKTFKRFNEELNTETLIRASNKLKKKGHFERSKELLDYSLSKGDSIRYLTADNKFVYTTLYDLEISYDVDRNVLTIYDEANLSELNNDNEIILQIIYDSDVPRIITYVVDRKVAIRLLKILNDYCDTKEAIDNDIEITFGLNDLYRDR